MSSFNPNSPKLREFVEAYEAGKHASDLASILNCDWHKARGVARGLVALGVMSKRRMAIAVDERQRRALRMSSIPAEQRAAMLEKARAAASIARAEYRAWKAAKSASHPIAAE